MPFVLADWLNAYTEAVTARFGERVWFIGLQGSHARGEATEQSDIDIVLILDEVTLADIHAYNAVLDALPYREKVCGFFAGKEELTHWEPADLCQFCADTLPLVAPSGIPQCPLPSQAMRQALRRSVCDIYHMGVHNLLHEKSAAILQGLYKSAFFVLRARMLLETGQYAKTTPELRGLLSGTEARILDQGARLKAAETVSAETFQEAAQCLFDWAAQQIRNAEPAQGTWVPPESSPAPHGLNPMDCVSSIASP